MPELPAGLTVLPGVIDHHVHLGLVDRSLLADSPVVEVHDLGWVLEDVRRWSRQPPHGLTIRFAGPFHTAPGGYPSGRSWAPDAAVRAVSDVADARAAAHAAARAGVDALKIALQTEMPLLGDELLRALVTAAHGEGLPAIVHAEGPGQAARAIEAGADTLVHTPWTEPLPDELLRRGLRMTWISTLAIHDGEARRIAVDNLGRFHALGGTVRYGTDMGNGPNPVGVNATEIELLGAAGLHGEELIAALTGPVAEAPARERALACERPRPRDAVGLIAWLGACRRLEAHDGGGRR